MATSIELARRLRDRFGDVLSDPVEFRGEVTLRVMAVGRLVEVCRDAKESLGFDLLLDMTGIDHYGSEPRWEVVYELFGTGHGVHLRLKASVSEEVSELPTISRVWRGAEWHEREAYDMLGIRFAGHPDLRRILMWEGYPYFPLRKDFPLAGKSSEVPGVAFTKPAPLDGGPFVTIAGGVDAIRREPRVRTAEARD